MAESAGITIDVTPKINMDALLDSCHGFLLGFVKREVQHALYALTGRKCPSCK